MRSLNEFYELFDAAHTQTVVARRAALLSFYMSCVFLTLVCIDCLACFFVPDRAAKGQNLVQLEEETRNIGDDGLAIQFEIDSNDEIGNLSRAFTPPKPNATATLTSRLTFFAISGFDGHFKRLNPAWAKISGFSPEELLSRPFMDFVFPGSRAEAAAELDKLMTGHVRFPSKARCAARMARSVGFYGI